MNLKFVFNNARSLHKHFFDIKADPNALSADIIGKAESRLCESDKDEKYSLDGFKIFHNDGKTDHCSRSHHGIVLYVKNNLTVLSHNSFSSDSIEFSVINVIISNSEVQCVALYKKPSCHLQVLCKTLENKLLPFMQNNAKTVIMGDFNLEPDSKPIETITSTLDDSKNIANLAFGPEGTFNGFHFDKTVKRRIDYIFVTKSSILVKKYAVLSDNWDLKYPSDHLPVFITFQFLKKDTN